VAMTETFKLKLSAADLGILRKAAKTRRGSVAAVLREGGIRLAVQIAADAARAADPPRAG
jgi:hypothetical protein